jgi:hypothetical protein
MRREQSECVILSDYRERAIRPDLLGNRPTNDIRHAFRENFGSHKSLPKLPTIAKTVFLLIGDSCLKGAVKELHFGKFITLPAKKTMHHFLAVQKWRERLNSLEVWMYIIFIHIQICYHLSRTGREAVHLVYLCWLAPTRYLFTAT